MIIRSKTIQLDTQTQVQLFDLTQQVKEFVAESG